MNKKIFKVLNAIPKKDGSGAHWVRLGTGYTNKDASINVYLDAMPKDFKLQLRELDETDLRREPRQDGQPPPARHLPPPVSSNDVPF